jgi:hypothetical protein
MQIQHWIYLGLAGFGLISLLMTLAWISLWLEEKLLTSKTDFISRLNKGEVLHKGNIF